MKIFLVFTLGILLGAIGAAIPLVQLSSEAEAQARLTGVTSELGTIAIYLKKESEPDSECFLLEQGARQIELGKEIESKLLSNTISLSSLNLLHTKNLNQAISYFEAETKSRNSLRCKEA